MVKSLNQTLLKKCFRDIKKNLKQFLAIIFIIATSVTLFVGLEANYVEFEKRINYVFDASNMADIFVTCSPDLDEKNEDLLYFYELLKDKGTYEKRLLVPSFNYDNASLTGLFYDSFPSISHPYELETIRENTEDNFFYLDKAMINSLKKLGTEVSLGDEISLNFSKTQLDSLITTIIGEDSEIINQTVKELILTQIKDPTLKFALYLAIERMEDQDMIKNSIPAITTKILENDNDSISFDFKITGIMKHPENIESGDFASTSFLMSQKLFLNALLKRIESNLNIDFIKESLVILKDNGLDEVSFKKANEYVSNNKNVIINSLNGLFNELNNQINSSSGEHFLANLYDQIVIKVNNEKDIDSLYDEIKNYFNNKEESNLLLLQTRSSLSSTVTLMNDLSQSKMLALSFPLIFFLVAVLVVLTTISQILLKERTQIGTMKALGITKGKILSYYAIMMNIITFIGVLLGFIVGPIMLPRVMNIKYDILYALPTIGYSFPVSSALITLLGVAFLTTLLTFILIRHELGLTPVESMRNASPRFKMAKHSKFVKNTSLMMALRNIRVYLSKSIMVIVGIMGCTGLLICGFGVDDTINYGVKTETTNFVNGDLNLTYSLNTPLNYNRDELLTFENVAEVGEYGVGAGDIVSTEKQYSFNYYYVSKESSLFNYDDNHEWNDGEIGVSKSFLEDTGFEVGDTVEIKLNNKIYNVKIAYSFYTFVFKGIYLYQEDPVFNTLPQVASAAVIKLKDVSKATETKEEILNSEILKVETIMTREETSNQIQGYVSAVDMMTNTVKAFAIVLAVIVLVNLAILNFNERIREIATLRVLGFTRNEIGRSLVYEIMILTFVGCLLGLALGFPLELLVLYTNRTELVSYGYIIYPLSYVVSFLISWVTALIVNIFVSRKINKVPMAESLKSIE